MSKLSVLSAPLVKKFDMSPAEAENFVTTLFRLIRETLETDRIVKVKGLGTFKLTDISARESIDVNTGGRITISSRSKISFTPENAVRDRINAPFASFETIDIDDDVNLDEIDRKYSQSAETVVEEPAAEETVAEEAPAKIAETVETPKPENPVIVETPKADTPIAAETPKAETSEPATVRSPYCENLIREEMDQSRELMDHNRKMMGMLKWILGIVIVILICVGLYFAYNMGVIIGNNTVEQEKTYEVAKPVKKVAVKKVEAPTTTPTTQDSTLKTQNSQPATQTTELPNQDIYNKDARVRTGAYVITGLETEVTVLKGQTLEGISKAYLGDGMQCYVEAFNGGITSVKPGDKVKIPKVKTKKSLKKK